MTVHNSIPQKKLERLFDRLAEMKRAMIALSGGIDSCFLLSAAREVLGEDAIAATAVSAVHIPEDIADAERYALSRSAHHLIVHIDVMSVSSFTENNPDRCYQCKKILYRTLQKQAAVYSVPYILDGTHADDKSQFRPGMKAVKELGIKTPLHDIGFSKEEIRLAAKHLGVSFWNKPSRTCLATRIPYGTPLTQKILTQISLAETFLHSRGFSQVRVRHYGPSARIELSEEELGRAADPGERQKIVHHFKDLGYAYVSLDLEGYRSGSMDEI